jgi:spore coat polysaccharide biosynthesis predicted glycosyltransferase SpsG
VTRAIIRCDGGAAIGMGHVSRCLALADALRDEHAGDVSFAMRDPRSAGVAEVTAAGYAVAPITAPADADYGADVAALIRDRGARALVLDVRDGLSPASLDAIRASGVRIIVVDDGSERRLAADLVFYPPVPQVEELDWRGFTGQRFAGWEWVLLKREFSRSGLRDVGSDGSDRLVGLGKEGAPVRTGGMSGPGALSEETAAVDVLVTMGGSDPAGMTEFTMSALNLLPMTLAVQIVVGPAFARPIELADAVARSSHAVRVVVAPAHMAPLMRASRIAVAAFGVSAYELAACGVPAVHLDLTADHARSATAFEREQIAVNAGVFAELKPRDIADAAARLIGDAGLRTRMASRARELVDGRGASRVARRIVESL